MVIKHRFIAILTRNDVLHLFSNEAITQLIEFNDVPDRKILRKLYICLIPEKYYNRNPLKYIKDQRSLHIFP